MSLKKRLAMLMAAGTLVFGAKAQSPNENFHDSLGHEATVTHQENVPKTSKNYSFGTIAVLNSLAAILLLKKKKKR